MSDEPYFLYRTHVRHYIDYRFVVQKVISFKKNTLEYKKIQQNELQFLSLTGLSPTEFEALSIDFSVELEVYMSKYTFEGKERVRLYKPRKGSSLPTVEDKLFFILFFMKTNPLQEHHAVSFSITQPQATMYLHLFIPLLEKKTQAYGRITNKESLSDSRTSKELQ
ncbi:hypothetical protein EZS27_018017 [termite gut metagenome]|uniref:Transposase Helix-turn-helix domain-containing protein n=1 Tax=termite gut metagenome TaxID=433724 RepID=A0A5J4RKB0_9ZZZZ